MLTGTVADMKIWLEMWKQKCQDQQKSSSSTSGCLTPRKRPKMRKSARPATPTRGGRLDSDWASDCSYDSDDSMCGSSARYGNTVLLQGPTGSGKTAMVYALAHQLGYKVIEYYAALFIQYLTKTLFL